MHRFYERIQDEIDHLLWRYHDHEEMFWIFIILLIVIILTLIVPDSGISNNWDSEYRQMQLEESYNL